MNYVKRRELLEMKKISNDQIVLGCYALFVLAFYILLKLLDIVK